MVFEYEDGPDGFPILTRCVERDITREEGKDYESETVYVYKLSEASKQADDSEFSLSAFGLPEPEGVYWKRPRRYLWLIGVAVALGALALILGMAARRTKPSSKSST